MDHKTDVERLETLRAECSCGWQGIVLVDITRDYFAFCPKCQKKIYGVNCKKCETGFSYPEDKKIINLTEKSWQCEYCREINQLSKDAENYETRAYNNAKDLPQEIRQALKERSQRDRKITLPIIIVLSIFILTIILTKILPSFKALSRNLGF